MEFYLDKFYNYQAGGQSWNVDFTRLPASEQAKAFAAVGQPGTPDNLVTLTRLQAQYPSAFSRVSDLSALPAPTLSGDSAILLNASVDTLLAFILNKLMETGNDLSAGARQNAIRTSHAEMGLADRAKEEKDASADKNMAGQLAAGLLSIGAGVGSFGMGLKAARDCRVQGGAMKDSSKAQVETRNYQETMEHNVKQLKDGAQASRADAQRLQTGADEALSPEGLSPASRQKIDDAIADRNRQLKDCADQRSSYDAAIKKAEDRAKDGTLSEAKRAKAQLELSDLKAREGEFKTSMDARETRLKQDVEALQAVKDLDDNNRQRQAGADRLLQLQDQGVRTPAEELEMGKLEADLSQRSNQVVVDKAKVQGRINALEKEATQSDQAAAALQQATQKELESRQHVQAHTDQNIAHKSQEIQSKTQAYSAAAQTVGTGSQAVSAVPGALAQKDQAEAEKFEAYKQFDGVSREADVAFAEALKQLAEAARDFVQKQADLDNELTKTVAGNMA